METLATVLVWLALLLVVLFTVNQVAGQNRTYLEEQQRWDKLVTIADFVVKQGGAYDQGATIYPNWVDDGKLAQMDREVLRTRMGLQQLSIGYAPAEGVCLYRLVVRGAQKEIAQLWVCGV